MVSLVLNYTLTSSLNSDEHVDHNESSISVIDELPILTLITLSCFKKTT